MDIMNIVETFNSFLKSQRELQHITNNLGFLVVLKTIEDVSNFKVYKKYNIKLYFNSKYPVITISENINTSNTDNEQAWDILSKTLLLEIFNILNSSNINKLIDGTYETE